MDETIRAFIGIGLPEKMVSFFREIQVGIRSYGLNLKLIKPENIHITLKFLGNIDKGAVKKIGYAMEDAVCGQSQIILMAKGIGCFQMLENHVFYGLD